MIKNILANFVGRFWSLLSVFIFIPFYIHFLGIELFGLVSFFATIQTLLFLLDAGLTAAIRREFSSGVQNREVNQHKFRLLRSTEFYYLIIALLIAGLIFLSVHWLVNDWLHLENISPEIARTTIRLMGISIGILLFSSLYSGALMGLEKQVLANAYQMIWSLCRNGLVIVVLWLVSSDIRLFYLWFIIIDLLYVFLLRSQVKKSLGVDNSFFWNTADLTNLSHIWKYSVGVLIVSIISAFTLQIDKLVISRFLPISDLGTYSLAFSLSQIPVIIVNAASIAIFPRFVYYHSTNDTARLNSLFSTAAKIFGITAISISVSICFYTRELLEVWTRDPTLVSKAWIPASILSVAGLMLSLQVLPSNLAFARGVTRINRYFGLIGLIMIMAGLFILVKLSGITGAAYAWLITMLIITPAFNCYIYKQFIEKNWFRWFFNDTLLPLFFITIISFVFYLAGRNLVVNPGLRTVYAVVTGVLTLAITLLFFVKDLRIRLENIRRELIR
jgi:O-antigen/teichoic acid export membrane protein